MSFLRRCGLGASVALVAVVSGCSPESPAQRVEPVSTATTTQAYTNTLGFDFDHGNAAFEVVIPGRRPGDPASLPQAQAPGWVAGSPTGHDGRRSGAR